MTGPNASNASNATLTKSGAASAANPTIAVSSPSTLSPSSALLIDSAPIFGSSSDGLDRDVIPNFPHIFAKAVGPAGMGLFTSKSLGPGELVLKDTRPLGCVLNIPLLEHRCAWCLTGPSSTYMKSQEHICLKKCGGCSVVRFCNQVGGFPFFATRYLLSTRDWKGFLDSFVFCCTEQVLGWTRTFIALKEMKNMEFYFQISKFYSYLNSVADLQFLGLLCGSSVGSNLEYTLIRSNIDRNSVQRLQIIC